MPLRTRMLAWVWLLATFAAPVIAGEATPPAGARMPPRASTSPTFR